MPRLEYIRNTTRDSDLKTCFELAPNSGKSWGMFKVVSHWYLVWVTSSTFKTGFQSCLGGKPSTSGTLPWTCPETSHCSARARNTFSSPNHEWCFGCTPAGAQQPKVCPRVFDQNTWFWSKLFLVYEERLTISPWLGESVWANYQHVCLLMKFEQLRMPSNGHVHQVSV